MSALLGAEFAGYRMDAVAGRGGMGVVYRATSLRLDRPVALKVVTPQLEFDREVRARFLRESRLAASLEHPNVVPIYEAGEHEGTLFIAMRFVEGTDLSKLIREHPGGLDPKLAVAIVAQVASALDAAHARGLIHRDIKPANILLAEEAGGPHAYLTDFGLAKQDGSSLEELTQTGQWIGTPDFAAPEQVEGRPLDARADGYALACVLFAALTGRPPFQRDAAMATAWAQVHEPPPKPRSLRPELPPGLDRVLIHALGKRPHERFASAGELARAARAALRGGQAPTSSTAILPAGATPGTPDAPTAHHDPREGNGHGPFLTGPEKVAPRTAATRRAGAAPAGARKRPRPAPAPAVLPRSLAPPTARRPAGPPPAPPAPPASRRGGDAPRRRPRRWPWVMLILIGLLVIAGGGVYYAVQELNVEIPGLDDAPKKRTQARKDPTPTRTSPAPTPAPTPPPTPAAANPDAGVVRCGPPETCRQGTTEVSAPAESASCRHDARPGQWVRLDEAASTRLLACVPYYRATVADPKVPDLTGARLDRAGEVLDADGIPWDTDGETGILGVLDEANWTVCQVQPGTGSPLPGGDDVLLVIARSC